jgi:hypothetical protein
LVGPEDVAIKKSSDKRQGEEGRESGRGNKINKSRPM